MEIAVLLLDNGADINLADEFGMSPLSRACAQCATHINNDMVRLLIARGADIKSKDLAGMTALHFSSREGHELAVKALLEAGAKARHRSRFGNALDQAEANRKTKILDMLRENMGMVKA